MSFAQSIAQKLNAYQFTMTTDQKRTPNSKYSGLNTGQWNRNETKKYFLFLYHHQSKFQTQQLRKSLKIFKLMSYFIKTRSSSQCQTHHVNIMSYGECIELILQKYISEHPNFLKSYENVLDRLTTLQDYYFCEQVTSKKARQSNQTQTASPENINKHYSIEQKSDSEPKQSITSPSTTEQSIKLEIHTKPNQTYSSIVANSGEKYFQQVLQIMSLYSAWSMYTSSLIKQKSQ